MRTFRVVRFPPSFPLFSFLHSTVCRPWLLVPVRCHGTRTRRYPGLLLPTLESGGHGGQSGHRYERRPGWRALPPAVGRGCPRLRAETARLGHPGAGLGPVRRAPLGGPDGAPGRLVLASRVRVRTIWVWLRSPRAGGRSPVGGYGGDRFFPPGACARALWPPGGGPAPGAGFPRGRGTHSPDLQAFPRVWVPIPQISRPFPGFWFPFLGSPGLPQEQGSLSPDRQAFPRFRVPAPRISRPSSGTGFPLPGSSGLSRGSVSRPAEHQAFAGARVPTPRIVRPSLGFG